MTRWRQSLSGVVLFLMIASLSFADHPGRGKPAYFGFAFNYPKGGSEMRLGVCAVADGSPAAAAGVRLDDLISAVDDKRSFRNALEVLEYLSQLEAGYRLQLDLIRGKESLTVTIVAAEATEQQQARMKQNLQRAKEEAARGRAEN